MDRPIPSANLKLAQMHDRVLQEYLAEQDRGDLITRVRESIIQQLPSGDANKDQVAADLLMSSRTLQRRLSDEGTNFAEVLNETRKELASVADTKLARHSFGKPVERYPACFIVPDGRGSDPDTGRRWLHQRVSGWPFVARCQALRDRGRHLGNP